MDEDRSFLGRVAVVTGASRAVGVGIATLLGFGGVLHTCGKCGRAPAFGDRQCANVPARLLPVRWGGGKGTMHSRRLDICSKVSLLPVSVLNGSLCG